MATSDIYEVKESPWASRTEQDGPASKKRRRSRKTFKQAADRDLSKTHLRRSSNSGFRRLMHLLKRKEFSGKFWLIVLGLLGAALAVLVAWDMFFRYPDQQPESEADPGPVVQTIR